MPKGFEERLRFQGEDEVMDVDFSDFTFDSSATVHAFYDHIEQRIHQTGKKWYFLVNYRNCRIYPEAWTAFAVRGKRVNEASSLGSVRYETRDETQSEIRRRAEDERFDPNLFESREAALARIAEWREAAAARRTAGPAFRVRRAPSAEHKRRVCFLEELQVMEADFSDWTFDCADEVNAFFDEIEPRLEATGRKWFFLVDYRGCRILPEAWGAFAHRGKLANMRYSLGTARFAPRPETGAEIRARSRAEDFDPSLFESREAALAHLQALRQKG